MTAVVVPVGQEHRAVCDDEGCRSVLLRPWRSWPMSQVRATSTAADHNRARHGAK